MERIKNITEAQTGDLLYIEGSLFVISKVDFDDDMVYLKLDNGTTFKKTIPHDGSYVIFRSMEKI